jgi:hypothetical protein
MARHLYPGTLVQLANGASAPNMTFTVWDDQTAGNNVTALLRASDGTSAYTAVTDSYGLQQPFRGPDDTLGGPPLFIETGIGVRFQVNSSTGWSSLYTQVQTLAVGGGGAVSSVAGRTGAVTLTKLDVGLANVDDTSDSSKPVSTAQQAALNAKADDAGVVHKTGAETVSGVKTFTSPVPVAEPTAASHAATKNYVDTVVSTGGTGGAVSSVAGKTGAVTLTKSDVGLANVDNTADTAKPVSTAQQTALNAKADDAQVVHKSLAETITGAKTFTGTVTVPAPVNPTDAATRAFVLANSGSGGTASLPMIDASKAPYNVSTTGTAVANAAGLKQATIDANGKVVTLPGGDYPLSGLALTDQHVNWWMPGVWFAIPATGGDTGITIERTPAAPMSVGATYLTWWGAWNPSGVTKSSLMQVIPATGLNRFIGGRTYHISSADRYPWAWSAQNLTNADGSSNYAAKSDGLATQAEFFTLLGIGVTVNIAGTGPMEQMMVQGATSGATGLIRSALTGNANGGITATQSHITFTQVSGDFVAGETLNRIAGGNPNGGSGSPVAVGASCGTVVGSPVLLTTDTFPLQYGRTTAAQATAGTATPVRTDNTVQLREIDMDPMCVIEGPVGFDIVGTDAGADSYVVGANRHGGMELRGVYAPRISYRVRNAWTRVVAAWSIYMGNIDGTVDHMPNAAYLDQSAFAYGLELKSAAKANRITLQGHSIRHLFTTNPNERTYAAANDNSAGKWTQWDYGTPIRNTIHDSVVESAMAPGMDTHPGDYYTLFENVVIHGGGSGGRFNTDNNSAYSSRGFGTTWRNVTVSGSVTGFNIGGVEHDAGLNHTYKLENVTVEGALAYGVYCPGAMIANQATIEINGGTISHRVNYPKDAAGTSEPTNTKYNPQASIYIGDGVNVILRGDVRCRRFGHAMLWTRGTGFATIYSAIMDATESPTSAAGLRIDPGAGVGQTVKVFELKVDGTVTSILRNQTGNSTWLLGDIQWLGTGTAPTLTSTIAGTPTYTQVAPLTNAGGGGSSGGTQVSVDGTNVSTLDISSTPVVQVVTLASDAAGPAASANVADVAGLQKTLPVGDYLVRGVVLYQMSASGGGSLRVGLGGAGAAGASTTGIWVDQNTTASAKSGGVVNALAAGGATAVTAAGTANVSGTSAGTGTLTLPFLIDGKLTVTTAGVLGIIAQLSVGATSTPTFKAGSYLSFTKTN